jgi:Mannosyl-glycoprotein endo-beta-N-acetylglucosaminidase
VATNSPFLTGRESELNSETESLCGQADVAETEVSGMSEFDTALESESVQSFENESLTFRGGAGTRGRGWSKWSNDSFDQDPYADIRSAMDPEHANLGANEITLVFGRMPATLVLHQLVNSPEMRQATLASLLGKRARRSVRFHGSDISIPAYLRMVSRLCREVAEQSEAESEQSSALGETTPMSEYQLAVDSETLAGSVGRNGRNIPSDVKLVQRLINANLPIPLAPLAEDGVCGSKTISAIEIYQQRNLGMNPPDGRVDPGGQTFHSLTGGGAGPQPQPSVKPKKNPVGNIPQEIIAAAQGSHTTWNIPASVTIAQWIVESYWGNSMPAGSNNPFGIKAVGNQPFVEAHTHETIKGKDVVIVARFRKFGSIADAFDSHGRLLGTAKPYEHARTLVGDPDAFADALTGVYATAPNYGSVLKNLMKKYNLYQYD